MVSKMKSATVRATALRPTRTRVSVRLRRALPRGPADADGADARLVWRRNSSTDRIMAPAIAIGVANHARRASVRTGTSMLNVRGDPRSCSNTPMNHADGIQFARVFVTKRVDDMAGHKITKHSSAVNKKN